MKQLSFTKEQFATFKKRYKIALKLKDDSFWFEGNEFLTSYAKYLIEYIESLEPQQ
jgi:hypothetical protein